MSRIAFIFPGQGAQAAGMGKDFYEQSETAREVFDKASALLGFSMPELCFEPNDRLDITEYTQAAMVTTSIAMMKVLKEKGVKTAMTKDRIITSARRFPPTFFGRIRVMWLMNRLRKRYRDGEDIGRIAEAYRDIR